MSVLHASAQRHFALARRDGDAARHTYSSTGDFVLDLPRNVSILNGCNRHGFGSRVDILHCSFSLDRFRPPGDHVGCLARRRRSKLVAAIADKSACRILAFALWAHLGPRFPAWRPFYFLAGGLPSGSRDCVGTRHGALWMHARRRIRCLAAHRTKCSRRSYADGTGFSFAHVVCSIGQAPIRVSTALQTGPVISAIARSTIPPMAWPRAHADCQPLSTVASMPPFASNCSALMPWTCSAQIDEERPVENRTAPRSASMDERASHS
jgi:hypothetical protein